MKRGTSAWWTKSASSGGAYRGHEPLKAQFAVETEERTLTDALDGADVLVGLSGKGLVQGEMLKKMARDPIVFALANPEPEITPEEARAARPDVIMATGRSDYPNQVNNVLGFPFISGRARRPRDEINEDEKSSRRRSPRSRRWKFRIGLEGHGVQEFRFGREYLTPSPSTSGAALGRARGRRGRERSGVARQPITDMAAYLRRWRRCSRAPGR